MERQLRGLLLMLFLGIVGYQTSQGQVKIQESVSINSASDAAANGYIFVPKGYKLLITPISKNAASTMALVVRSPLYTTIFNPVEDHLGETWTSDIFMEDANVDVGIVWSCDGGGGDEVGKIVTQGVYGDSNKSIIEFEDSGLDWDYNDLVVITQIVPLCLHITLTPSSLESGDTAQVTLAGMTSSGEVVPYASWQNFSVSISEGSSYGFLHASSGDGTSVTGTSPMLFIANSTMDSDSVQIQLNADFYIQPVILPGLMNNLLSAIPMLSNTKTAALDTNSKTKTMTDTVSTTVRSVTESQLHSLIFTPTSTFTTCGAAEANGTITFRFPECDDFTFPHIKDTIKEDKTWHGESQTQFWFPEGNLLGLEICHNSSSDCYGLMLHHINLGVGIAFRSGTDGINGGKNVDSENDISSNKEKKEVIAKFTETIRQIDLEMYAYQTGGNRSGINMDDYQSNGGILTHERVHVEDLKQLIRNEAAKIKASLPKCVHYHGNKSTIEACFDQDISNCNDKYYNQVTQEKSKIAWNTQSELKAYEAQKKYLLNLIGRIQKKDYSKK